VPFDNALKLRSSSSTSNLNNVKYDVKKHSIIDANQLKSSHNLDITMKQPDIKPVLLRAKTNPSLYRNLEFKLNEDQPNSIKIKDEYSKDVYRNKVGYDKGKGSRESEAMPEYLKRKEIPIKYNDPLVMNLSRGAWK